MPQRASRPRQTTWRVHGSPAAYESALARAHRAVFQAQMEAQAMQWFGEEYDLGCILNELSQLGAEALARKRRRAPQSDELPSAG